jgi:hypothetical protein
MTTSEKLDLIKIIVAALAAIPALWVYYTNSRLRRAEWLASLYEKFYEKIDLKDIREILDCEGGRSADIDKAVAEETCAFTDYLNFFEFVAVLEKSGQLKKTEIEDLFGYYLDCLENCPAVRNYLAQKGYERLDRLLRDRPRRS